MKQFLRKLSAKRRNLNTINTTILPRNAVTVLHRGLVTDLGLGARHRERGLETTTTTRAPGPVTRRRRRAAEAEAVDLPARRANQSNLKV